MLYVYSVQTFGLIPFLTKVSAWRFFWVANFIHFMRLQRELKWDLKFLNATVASLTHRLMSNNNRKTFYKLLWLQCITDPSELDEPFDVCPIEPLPTLGDRGGVSRGSVLTESQTRNLSITISTPLHHHVIEMKGYTLCNFSCWYHKFVDVLSRYCSVAGKWSTTSYPERGLERRVFVAVEVSICKLQHDMIVASTRTVVSHQSCTEGC